MLPTPNPLPSPPDRKLATCAVGRGKHLWIKGGLSHFSSAPPRTHERRRHTHTEPRLPHSNPNRRHMSCALGAVSFRGSTFTSRGSRQLLTRKDAGAAGVAPIKRKNGGLEVSAKGKGGGRRAGSSNRPGGQPSMCVRHNSRCAHAIFVFPRSCYQKRVRFVVSQFRLRRPLCTPTAPPSIQKRKKKRR